MSAALTFAAPLPGLGSRTDYDLSAIDGAQGLYALTSDGGEGARLFVLDAAVYLPGYSPVLSTEQCSLLELMVPDQAQLLVIATPSAEGTSVNLLAPIVVNRDSLHCAQMILEGQDWPVKAQLSLN